MICSSLNLARVASPACGSSVRPLKGRTLAPRGGKNQGQVSRHLLGRRGHNLAVVGQTPGFEDGQVGLVVAQGVIGIGAMLRLSRDTETMATYRAKALEGPPR